MKASQWNTNPTSETKELTRTTPKSVMPPAPEKGIVVSGFNDNMGGIRSQKGADKLTVGNGGKPSQW